MSSLLPVQLVLHLQMGHQSPNVANVVCQLAEPHQLNKFVLLDVLWPFCTSLAKPSRSKARWHYLDQNETRSTGGAGAKDSIPNFANIVKYTRKRAGIITPWRGVNSIPRRTTYQVTVGCMGIQVQGLLFCLRIIYNEPPSRPQKVAFYYVQGEGWGVFSITQILQGYPFTRPQSRTRA